MSPQGRNRGDGAHEEPGGPRLVDWRPLPGRGSRVQRQREIRSGDRPDPLPAHVGAWLDRYLWEGSTPKDDKPGRMALLESAIEALKSHAPATEMWKEGYAEWQRRFVAPTSHVLRADAIVEAKSRILLHVNSGSSVTDGSILLHHTWGIPYLPGSALKGLVRAAMQETSLRRRFSIAADGAALLADLLGQGPSKADSTEGSERASFIDFLDAPWVPSTPAGRSPLALDVVTPHHGRYYTTPGEKRPFPTDFDEPVPTHRLSITPGTRFHIVLEADASFPKPWLQHVWKVLAHSLKDDGIGAWTTSGYGRLEEHTGVDSC